MEETLALLTGIAKRVDEQGKLDTTFLQGHCDRHDDWIAGLRAVAWDEVLEKSGVSRAEIDGIAADYIAANNVIFSWTMGITHHAHGVENVQAIANLALARGMVGRPAAGLLPIRGHSNVQGMGSLGVTPRLKDTIFRNLQDHYGCRLPTTRGLDTLSCIESSAEGKMRVGVCLGGNLYGSNPDAQFAEQALAQLELVVYLSTTLNTGHTRGLARRTLILPVLARDEEPQPTTQESMFNYVRLSDGGPARHDGPRSEIAVIAELGAQLVGDVVPWDWHAMQATQRIRDAIAKVVPGWEAIGRIDATRQEFQIDGRTLHTPRFPTSSGRARLHRHALPPLEGDPHQLRLMTVRSEGQFNTVVYEEEDIYRGQTRRDVILIHPDDISRLGLRADQRVTVRSRDRCHAAGPSATLHRHPRRQRADVLPGGQCPRTSTGRPSVKNTGI